ncbi:MAG: ligand-binding sensor domain-containing protein [Nonlabens sp.]|jgi:ligand-binding sensor domain-containing protein|uniref:type IX secretion system anionic LPS delivery protein PorZ n=1 Tax=Nonlabens sp. TaxID=1888209 RepID=UPI0039E3CAD9
MKKALLFILLAGNITAAQDFTGSWEGLFSFTTIVDIEESSTAVYAASENAVFIYDLNSRSFTTLTTVNGLSGDEISQIHYSEDKSALIIGYENGLLQIVDQDGQVNDVVAIKDKQSISPVDKRINEFIESGDLIYMATDFGIAIYNLERLEFDDTYFIGDNGIQVPVASIEIFDGFLYAATLDANSGMRRAPIADPFLIDFMNWNQINIDIWTEVITFDNRLFAVTVGRFLAELNTTSGTFASTGIRLPQAIRDAHATSDFITFTSREAIYIYDRTLNQIYLLDDIGGTSYNYTAGIVRGTILYAGTEAAGMIRINIQDQTDFDFIVADGPSRNAAFSISSSPGELWVGYGNHDVFYNPFPLERLGISYFREEESWVNYSFNDVLNAQSISSITVNPNDPNEVFLSSMQDGVVQFVDESAVTRFEQFNSSLFPTVDSNAPPPGIFYRISNSTFDRSGNLWVVQSLSDFSLHKRTPSGQWTAFDLSDEITNVAQSATKIVVTQEGNIIYGTTSIGLVGFDPETSQALSFNVDNNLINNYVASLRLDLNGQLWIGSNLGLRVLFNPNSMFTENPSDARSIIIEDTNGIPRELLADEAVLDIEIDGNNNKWVATASSGAFLFSPSGRETIFQFTTDNSPLPTNAVNDISIDESSGKIYFATDKGIVAFQGERSSKPEDNLESVRAFPNPVRPGFEGNVTIDGLTDRARVKITDIEGNLVYEAVSQGGSIPWDTRSFSGRKVASGVYFLFISTNDNIETTVSKLMIVR